MTEDEIETVTIRGEGEKEKRENKGGLWYGPSLMRCSVLAPMPFRNCSMVVNQNEH